MTSYQISSHSQQFSLKLSSTTQEILSKTYVATPPARVGELTLKNVYPGNDQRILQIAIKNIIIIIIYWKTDCVTIDHHSPAIQTSRKTTHTHTHT